MSGIYRFLEQKKITNLQYLTDRLKHAVFIGKNNDWMFVETPKCACSSLKRALIALEGETIDFKHVGMESSLAMSIHSRDVNPINGISLLSEDTISTLLNSKKITKFCIVRNPYARLASAWADKIRQREPGYIRLIEPINKYNNMDNTHSTPSFSDFVNWLVNKNKSDH
jgi:predicted nucleic acid-binding Zn finger protein